MTREIAISETYLPTYYMGAGIKGFNIVDVAKKMISNTESVTLDTSYLKEDFRANSYTQTPFKEIINMNIEDKIPGSRLGLLDSVREYDLPFNEIVSKLKEALKGYIVKCWDSNSPKLFLHSAGYDSRIVSGIITELREERGSDWIGDIHFRCHQPEGELFKQIMEAEGWDNSQYSLWEDMKENEDHYNLGRIEPVNGFMSFTQQYDFFSDYTKDREKDIIIIGGIYGGELFDYLARGKNHFKNFKYCDNVLLNSLHNYMLCEGGTITKYFDDHKYAIFPFLSYDYLEAATKMPTKYITRNPNLERSKPDNIREALLKSFDFDIYSIQYGRHDYHWNITNDTWNKMSKFYQSSKFYNDHKIDIDIPFKVKSYSDMMWTLSLMYDKIFNK
jgi:hypothetical protein